MTSASAIVLMAAMGKLATGCVKWTPRGCGEGDHSYIS